jgi:small-conductance mechanosensitive channel
MTRFLLLIGFGIAFGAMAASAQPPAKGSHPNGQPQISAQQASEALDVLNDPKQRADFIATLEAIVKLHPEAGTVPKPAATSPQPPPTSTTPGHFGGNVLDDLTMFFRHLSAETARALRSVRSAPLLWGWLKVMVTDPWAQGVLLDIAWRLVLAMGAGLLAQWAIGRALRRPRAALARRMPNGNGNGAAQEPDGEGRAERGETEPPRSRRLAALTLLLRLPLVFARLLIDLLPVAGFAVIAHLIADSPLGGDPLTHGVIAVVVNAYVVYAALICIGEMMFSPSQPGLRLLNVSTDAAAYAMRWVRRIVLVGLIAPTIGSAGVVLGMSDSARQGLLTAGSFVDHVLVAIIVLQQRRTVAAWIAAPEGDAGVIATLRNGLAAAWHWIALFLIGVGWLVAAVEVHNGFTRVLYLVAEVIAILVIGRIALIVALGLTDRLLRLGSLASQQYPSLEARLLLYRGASHTTVRSLVYLIGVLALLQLVGLHTLAWLTRTAAGQQLLGALVSVALTVLLAIVVWEVVNAAIERHLARLTNESQGPRSARLRTLLPLLRSTLLITILTVATLMALSEMGVNIGPLLAGAGIVGVAIGFGSQKLVQDVITGIFLLLENAMQVGDWVTVSGLSGTVENLSVRTIRLRAGDGSVHIIPFSSVTSVTNVNRGLGNASVNVCLSHHEDTDRASEVLKEIIAAMRTENDFSTKMLSDLQLWGVDKVDGASVTIAGQVVCTDSGRWNVQREFNWRMKKRFEELGIELYNPVQRMIAVTQMAKASGDDEA